MVEADRTCSIIVTDEHTVIGFVAGLEQSALGAEEVACFLVSDDDVLLEPRQPCGPLCVKEEIGGGGIGFGREPEEAGVESEW